jgi:hypothetical protein
MGFWIQTIIKSNDAFPSVVHKRAYTSSQSTRALCGFLILWDK